jgi:hypothetical protein
MEPNIYSLAVENKSSWTAGLVAISKFGGKINYMGF